MGEQRHILYFQNIFWGFLPNSSKVGIFPKKNYWILRSNQGYRQIISNGRTSSLVLNLVLLLDIVQSDFLESTKKKVKTAMHNDSSKSDWVANIRNEIGTETPSSPHGDYCAHCQPLSMKNGRNGKRSVLVCPLLVRLSKRAITSKWDLQHFTIFSADVYKPFGRVYSYVSVCALVNASVHWFICVSIEPSIFMYT